MTIKWLKNAISDIEDIKAYISKDSSYYAKEFTKRIIESVELLVNSPEIGRIVPELKNENIRELLFRNYRIIYRIYENEIQILAVIHGMRDLNNKENQKWIIN